MTRLYKTFVHFDPGYCHYEEVDEFKSDEEAKDIAQEIANSRLDYGAYPVCKTCRKYIDHKGTVTQESEHCMDHGGSPEKNDIPF